MAKGKDFLDSIVVLLVETSGLILSVLVPRTHMMFFTFWDPFQVY